LEGKYSVDFGNRQGGTLKSRRYCFIREATLEPRKKLEAEMT
jgi:hypothetical protein